MKQKDLMLLLVPSFIMVAAWVIFNIYHSSVSSTISENLNMQIIPINPTFNMQEIDAIKKRMSVSPSYELSAAPSPQATLPQVPTPSLIASSSAQASGSASINLSQQTSSSGGTIAK